MINPTCYEDDQIPLMVLLVRKLGEYLSDELPRGDKINPVHMEVIKTIMEVVQE